MRVRLCMYVCVCACVRACVCSYVCGLACVSACVRGCVHMRVRGCVSACMQHGEHTVLYSCKKTYLHKLINPTFDIKHIVDIDAIDVAYGILDLSSGRIRGMIRRRSPQV